MDRFDFMVLLGLIVALGACGGERLFGPEFEQGIEGVALIGPQCPVQTPTDPCPDLPHQARIDVLETGGRFVVSLQSDTAGAFRVGLRPGSYTLRPEGGDPFPSVDIQTVLVNPGVYTQVVVSFDTGIR